MKTVHKSSSIFSQFKQLPMLAIFFQRNSTEVMKLGLTYHTIFDYQHSRQAYDDAFTFRQRAGSTPPADLEPAPHPYRMDHKLGPLTLDPTKVVDAGSYRYIRNIFSGLFELGTENEIVPGVARSWEISEDGCQYLFHLRDDITWSDSTQATAADFEYARKRFFNPANQAPRGFAGLLYDIKGARPYHMGEISDPDQIGVRAIDATTLEVEMERPASYFLYMLTELYPVPQHVVETHLHAWTDPTNLVSNGPFMLESYLPGESITLVRNPTYHESFSGNIEVVEVKLALSNVEALEMYESDHLDIVGLSPETFPARYRYIEEYVSDNHPSTSFLTFNSSRPPLDNLSVRRALVMAVDRERLAGKVLGGYDNPATGGFVPPGIPGHSPGIGLPYDPDQARQLLAQAGYLGGKDFPILQLAVWPERVYFAEYLIPQWRQNLNIEVKIVTTEWTDFLQRSTAATLSSTFGLSIPLIQITF